MQDLGDLLDAPTLAGFSFGLAHCEGLAMNIEYHYSGVQRHFVTTYRVKSPS